MLVAYFINGEITVRQKVRNVGNKLMPKTISVRSLNRNASGQYRYLIPAIEAAVLKVSVVAWYGSGQRSESFPVVQHSISLCMFLVCVEICILSVVYLSENVLSHIVNTGIEHGLCKSLNTREEPGSSYITAKSNSINKTILFQHPTNKSSSLGDDAFLQWLRRFLILFR